MKKLIKWYRNKFWMKCDRCNFPMKEYALQGMTSDGCIYYCKKCSEDYLSKCKFQGMISMEKNDK